MLFFLSRMDLPMVFDVTNFIRPINIIRIRLFFIIFLTVALV